MDIAYIFVFILASQLIHSIAVDQSNGFNPYPFGTTIFCIALHPLLLTLSIWYLGWLCGILIFLCQLFGIVHATISWVCDIPTLVAKNEKQLFGIMKFKIGLLTPVLIATLAFTILSFIISDFKSLFYVFSENITYMIILVFTMLIGFVLRIFVNKFALKNID